MHVCACVHVQRVGNCVCLREHVPSVGMLRNGRKGVASACACVRNWIKGASSWVDERRCMGVRVGVSVSVFLCVSARAFAEGVVSIRCECMAL